MSSKNLLNSQQFFWTNQIIKINVVRSGNTKNKFMDMKQKRKLVKWKNKFEL